MSTHDPLPEAADFALGSEGRLHIDDGLCITVGTYAMSWRAQGRLLTRRGRVVTRVELEIDAWSNDATRLQVRPIARHPERWGRARLHRYFVLAHDAADHTARLLTDLAVSPQLHPVPELAGARMI